MTPHQSGHSPGVFKGGAEGRPAAAEDSLKTERIQIERKTFVLALKENPRGRFLRITEDVGGRRDSIIIPATGLEDLRRVIDDLARICRETPEKLHQP